MRRLARLSAPAGFALLAGALAACQTAPTTKIETIEVKVPIAIQPIRPEQIPNPPAALPPRPKGLAAASDLLLSRWCAAIAYILRADPLLHISAGEKPGDLAPYPECEAHK